MEIAVTLLWCCICNKVPDNIGYFQTEHGCPNLAKFLQFVNLVNWLLETHILHPVLTSAWTGHALDFDLKVMCCVYLLHNLQNVVYFPEMSYMYFVNFQVVGQVPHPFKFDDNNCKGMVSLFAMSNFQFLCLIYGGWFPKLWCFGLPVESIEIKWF